MGNFTALERLTRRLNLIGAALLAAAGVAFVWAVGFTRGVEGLIEGLVIAGVGLFMPGLATLWVSWIIGSAAGDDAFTEEQPVVSARERWTMRLRNYAVAALCVAIAAGTRELLTPYLTHDVPYATFFLAVTVAAWVGGMGPAVFAAVLSVPVAWKLFLESAPPSPDSASGLVEAGLFIAVALAIGGITAALRLTQTRAETLSAEMASRQAALDESEARYRDLADRSATMIWVADAARQRTFFNKAWQAFTGRPPEQQVGERWVEGLHPRDRERCLAQYRKAFDAREPFTLHYRLRRHDDVYRSIVDTGQPRFFPDGRLAGFTGECVDVTDVPQVLRELSASANATPIERAE
jgi:PAS domain S-box-containing protein